MTDAPTTKAEKRFHLGCLLFGLAAIVGPILYFVIVWLVEPSVGFVPPTLSSSKVVPESLAFGPEGKRLAVADHEGNVSVWNIETGAIEFHAKRSGATMASPPVLTISRNGTHLAAGFEDGEVATWSLIDSNERWAAPRHQSRVIKIEIWNSAFVVSTDAHVGLVASDLATGEIPQTTNSDGVLGIGPLPLGPEQLNKVRVVGRPFDAVFVKGFGGDGVVNYVAEYAVSGQVRIVRRKPRESRDVSLSGALRLERRHMAFGALGEFLFVAGQHDGKNAGKLYVVDAPRGKINSTVPFGRPNENLSLNCVAVSPNGKIVAVGLPDGVHLFDVDERGRLRRWAEGRVTPTREGP